MKSVLQTEQYNILSGNGYSVKFSKEFKQLVLNKVRENAHVVAVN